MIYLISTLDTKAEILTAVFTFFFTIFCKQCITHKIKEKCLDERGSNVPPAYSGPECTEVHEPWKTNKVGYLDYLSRNGPGIRLFK